MVDLSKWVRHEANGIVYWTPAEPLAPDADAPKVRTADEVRADALAEDRLREAVRRSNWMIRAKTEAERLGSAATVLKDILTKRHQ
jgi:hypothetical protein